jgi:hypothetical protein
MSWELLLVFDEVVYFYEDLLTLLFSLSMREELIFIDATIATTIAMRTALIFIMKIKLNNSNDDYPYYLRLQ